MKHKQLIALLVGLKESTHAAVAKAWIGQDLKEWDQNHRALIQAVDKYCNEVSLEVSRGLLDAKDIIMKDALTVMSAAARALRMNGYVLPDKAKPETTLVMPWKFDKGVRCVDALITLHEYSTLEGYMQKECRFHKLQGAR